MGQTEHQPGFPHQLDQRHRVLQVGGQRFVADDVNARLQKCLTDWIVRMVGGGNDDRLDSVVTM